MFKLILSVFLSGVAILADAQIVIKGKVLDNRSNQAVPNASVYFNNTSVGTVTDGSGEFVLNVKSIYTGELVVSSVGYQLLTYKINNTEAGNLFYTIKLEIKESVLTGILVMNDAQRAAWLKIFKENFLGITEEADKCKIKNIDAIYFLNGENKNSIYAYADTPLVIINELLGYTISFDLIEFSFNKTKNSTYFLGYSRYEEMGDRKKRTRRRKQNYSGSTMHFYRSLIKDKLKQEGYALFAIKKQNSRNDSGEVKQAKSDRSSSISVAVKISSSDVLFKDSTSANYFLKSADQLMVQYDEIPHSKFYLSNKVLVRGLNRFGFTSYITILADKVKLDKAGIIYSPLSVAYDGFWVYEKLANQLPFDYTSE